MARRAGIQHASAAMASIIRKTIANVRGSVGWTPYRICSRSRPAANAMTSPTTVPEPMSRTARRATMGIADGLIRLSVGIEDIADLREDLAQALAHAGARA